MWCLLESVIRAGVLEIAYTDVQAAGVCFCLLLIISPLYPFGGVLRCEYMTLNRVLLQSVCSWVDYAGQNTLHGLRV